MIEQYGNRRRQALARRQLYAACFLALTTVGGTGAVHAQSSEAPRAYAIEAGTLEAALNQLSRQSQVQIVFPPDVVAGKRASALSGQLTWRAALERLLQGSGLEYRQIADKTIIIQRSEPRPASTPKPVETPRPPPSATRAEPQATDLERMTVTGTRIRGGTTPSPVTTIGSEQIAEEGFTDLGEVVRSVPQNFTGGQNPGVFMGNVTGGGMANQNVTGGSSLNLRGLGPDASLTLLNGKRLAYSGFVQAVDIASIPVDAVDRVEIVADGASAIYGSDAVGGVANVILRRDYEGVAVGTRYGTATDGGLTTREYHATAGTAWASGGLIATFKRASVDPIYASDRSYSDHLIDPTTIYAGSELRSGLVSAHQSIGDTLELRLDALRTEREQTYNYYAGSLSIYNAMRPETTTSFVAPSLEFSLPNDWALSFGGAWGKDEFFTDHVRVDTDTRVATPLFYECHCNESKVYEASAEGPLFRTNAGDARLAVGAGYRRNEYSWDDHLAGATKARGTESSRFGYMEINLPLVGAQSNVSGVERLTVTAAVRSEDYDSFGRVSTPTLGVIYGPSADFTLKATWGKSFKAPTLFQRNYAMMAHLFDPSAFGVTDYAEGDTLLYLNGGNPDLDPERARTWTASLAFHPEALPGLDAELTWFNVDYTSRVIEPSAGYGALDNPIYAEFVDRSPTAERLADIVSRVDAFYNYTAAPYDPASVIAILDVRYVNANRQRVRGVDLSGSYRFDLGPGRLTIRGAASWLDSTQQTKGMPDPYDLAGTLFNPAKVNARIGAVWSQGGFSASTFANYTGGVTNTLDNVKSASFTTFDATLRYDTGERGDAWSGLEFALAAQNVLDRAPPLYAIDTPLYVAPYDSTNYSAIGRFLSLSVTKRW
ncbi:MAG: TonB-dependent receptor [Dokdonella sp.]|nr:TonB-dependent receptor [Dokdonella sp.]